MAQDHQHDHDHEHGEDESYGMALGFRIFEQDGQVYLAEVEITPYVDEPTALGATLVFHPLDEMDPTAPDQGVDWPAWPVDIDDDLTRDTSDPVPAQFLAIARQVGRLDEAQLGDYLALAREESAGESE
ncbi:MAG TPA: hypothetical protein VHG51_15680 [Longimicrobiaceae bacterium]|nr:hypothetical protein [Longimicrobiaceae bacterium]